MNTSTPQYTASDPLWAITLQQPWATLMAHGIKKLETRSWSTRQRGRVAITASKSLPKYYQSLSDHPDSETPLWELGYKSIDALPIGCILAVGELEECWTTREALRWITGLEANLGDYSFGRYAFEFSSMVLLREPIPVKGALGFWQVPAIAKSQVLAQLTPEKGRA